MIWSADFFLSVLVVIAGVGVGVDLVLVFFWEKMGFSRAEY